MNRKELYKELLEIAKEKGAPPKNFLAISKTKAEMLAKEYNANLEIVQFGVLLMDIQIGEAQKNNCVSEHVRMSSDFAKEFLKKSDFNEEEKEKIINCVEAHHGQVPFACIEAEICANADCYRFIHPLGVFTFEAMMAKRTDDFLEQIKALKFKLNEKKNILSLPKAKMELDSFYEIYSKQFDEIIRYMENLDDEEYKFNV